jgi:hypothetical protein
MKQPPPIIILNCKLKAEYFRVICGVALINNKPRVLLRKALKRMRPQKGMK